jgi:hypothetical protein
VSLVAVLFICVPVSIIATILMSGKEAPPIRCPEVSCNTRYFYLGENRAMVMAPHLENTPMFINTQDRGMVPHLITGSGWQSGETRYFSDSVEPGMTVVEIGANFGYYSLMWAKNLKQNQKNSKLILVEADPTTFQLLSDSFEINGLNLPFVHLRYLYIYIL